MPTETQKKFSIWQKIKKEAIIKQSNSIKYA